MEEIETTLSKIYLVRKIVFVDKDFETFAFISKANAKNRFNNLVLADKNFCIEEPREWVQEESENSYESYEKDNFYDTYMSIDLVELTLNKAFKGEMYD